MPQGDEPSQPSAQGSPSGIDLSRTGCACSTVKFAYNTALLTVQKGSEDPISFDREDSHELVHRYALFDADTGDLQMALC